MEMKCIFKDTTCPRPESHDACRTCKNAPQYKDIESNIEMKCLCAVAGNRDRQKKYFGSRDGKKPVWLSKLDKRYDHDLEIPCEDHRRYLDNMVILEPYDVDISEIKDLVKFCDENGLYFIIDGNSAHLPGRTFRITITKIKSKDEA